MYRIPQKFDPRFNCCHHLKKSIFHLNHLAGSREGGSPLILLFLSLFNMIFQNLHYEVNLFISFQSNICQIFFFFYPFSWQLLCLQKHMGLGLYLKEALLALEVGWVATTSDFTTPFQDSSVLCGPGLFLTLT